jgi:Chain length determinant protein
MKSKHTENDEISLKELIEKIAEIYNYLCSKWKVIILALVIGTSLGVFYSYIKKPIYKASLSFALEDEKGGGGLGNALGLASSFGLDLGGDGGGIFNGSNLIALFKSRSMVEKALFSPVIINGKVVSLAEMYIQDNKWRENWEENPRLINVKFPPNVDRKSLTRVHDSILGIIYNNLSKNNLSVEQKDKKVAITNIDVTSTDELFSIYLCEALVKQVGDFYVNTKSKKARTNMEILERQTDSIRRELNGAIIGVAVANDNTFNLNPALNVRRSPSARRQVDVQANTAILTELVKQSELAKVTLRKETPLIQVIDRPILPLPKERFSKTKGALLGFLLSGFIVVIFLSLKKIFKNFDLN